MPVPHERWWLVAILAGALLLRVVGLGGHAFWLDEVHMLIKSENFWPVFLWGELVSNHPPGTTAFLYLWRLMGLTGEEGTARLLTALMGTASVFTHYVFVRHILGPRAALWTAFLIAISAMHVLHSQEIKDYIMLPMVGPLMLWTLLRAAESNSLRWWVAYSFAAAASFYAEAFGALLLIAANGWFVALHWRMWPRMHRWFWANVAAFLMVLHVILYILEKVDNIVITAEDWWIPAPTLTTVGFFVKTVVFGYSGADPLFKVAMALYGLLAALGTLLVFRMRPSVGALLMACLVAPVAITYLVSTIGSSIFLFRALMPFGLMILIFAAYALAHMPRRASAMAAMGLAALSATPLYQYYNNIWTLTELPHRPGVHPRRDYDKAVAYIEEHWQEGDQVLHASMATWLPFAYYGLGDRGWAHAHGGMSQRYIDYILRSNPRVAMGEWWDPVFPILADELTEGKERVWQVYAEWERELLRWGPNSMYHWLSTRYTLVDQQSFKGVDIFLYETPAFPGYREAVARLTDDGVQAAAVLSDGEVIRQTLPDWGLVARPPGERAGRLRLRLDPPVINGGGPLAQQSAILNLSNVSAEPVTAWVQAVHSDFMLHAAALEPADFGSERWNYAWRTEIVPHGKEVHMTVVEAHAPEPGAPAAAYGAYEAPPGRYLPMMWFRGANRIGANPAPPVSILMNGVEAAPSPELSAGGDWRWYTGGEPLEIEAGGQLDIHATVRDTNPDGPTYMQFSYLALRRIDDGAFGGRTAVYPPWPGRVDIAPGKTMSWQVKNPGGQKRLDVWVTEQGAPHAYHCFVPLREALP